MKIKLEIKAADFEDSNYYNVGDCVITRALRRIGLNNLLDQGVIILDNKEQIPVISDRDATYNKLGDTVSAMYRNIIAREDFEVELDINYTLPEIQE